MRMEEKIIFTSMASHLVCFETATWCNSEMAYFSRSCGRQFGLKIKWGAGPRTPYPRSANNNNQVSRFEGHCLAIQIFKLFKITLFCTVCSLCSLVQSLFICFTEPKLSICLKTEQFQSSWWDLGRVSLHFAAFGNNVSLTSSTNLLRKQKPTTLHQTQAPYHGVACPLLHLAVIR